MRNGPERRLQMEDDLCGACGFDAAIAVEQRGVPARGLGVEDPLEGVDHVVGRERLAVVEGRVVDQIEHPGLLVCLLPLGGEHAVELLVLIDVDELGEDVVVDLGAGVDRATSAGRGVSGSPVSAALSVPPMTAEAEAGGGWAPSNSPPQAARTEPSRPPAAAAPTPSAAARREELPPCEVAVRKLRASASPRSWRCWCVRRSVSISPPVVGGGVRRGGGRRTRPWSG